ncbi:diguanylate cyclase [Massilia sp. DWR3-1-1]|uniref:diguanylate cyclase n=1 Tax=Massilia sp. DWR3-1-1 TaxID=2804559 RepID=UPI003CF144CF
MSAAPDFDLLDQLHTSARSRVLRARGRDGAALIVKQPNQEFPSFQDSARFRREFEIARRCAHAGVVAPLSLTQAGGRWTMVLADIGGIALDKLLRRRVLAPSEFFAIAVQLCDAVEAVHAQGIIHKDINPSNLVWNAEAARLQLIDFGIASELPQEAQGMVHPHALEGTLAYMAPEQTGRMNRLLDYRADLYAIGATLYTLLAGHPPFVAADAMELIHCHIARAPAWDLPALRTLPDGLLVILQRLLEKDAERRYQSLGALKADLEACRDARAPQPARLADRSARFVMPQTLYGREREVAALMAAFERAALGGTELLLVAGYSGIGKSAVVNEVHKPIVARRGAFLAGKFDQFRRDVPYASLIEALRTLVHQLLGEPEAQLAARRRQLHAALGAGLGVMVELLPELALVVGPVVAAAPLSPGQAQARLARVLPQFIDVFKAPGQPLVVFLDDLQWADAPTLRMIELLVRRQGGGNLLLIGAYRDNETGPGHPLSAMRARLERDALPVAVIDLAALTVQQVAALLGDALRADSAAAALLELARLCHRKTGGNPFFLNQFLQAMAEQGHLRYDAAGDCWNWDLAAIDFHHTTDNVGDLLATKIGRLPDTARSLLQLGASIGSRFDLDTLAVVAQLAPAAAQAALWPALEAGLVQPLDGRYKYLARDGAHSAAEAGGEPPDADADAQGGIGYRFLHDRVQQAAYLMADPAERAARHLGIGRLLLAHATPAQREANLFGIVEQINAGRELIDDADERFELARLNHLAAVKARRSAAFGAALSHHDIGLSLLPTAGLQPGWQAARPSGPHHGLWFELALGAAEAAYLCGDFAQAEAIYPRVRACSVDRLEHARCIIVQAHQYQLQGRLLDAIAVQREGLALLGFGLPEDAAELVQEAERQFEQLRAAQTAGGGAAVDAVIDALLGAPEMVDAAAVAAMQMMQGLWMAGYYAGQQALCTMMIMAMTRLSIDKGNSDFTAVGYTGFAMMQVVRGFDPAIAYRFGAMAVRLARSRDNLQTRTLSSLMFGAATSHWTRPLRDSDVLYDEAFGWALEIGDYVQVGVVAAVRATDRIALGAYLPDLLESVRRDLALMRANGQQSMADCCVAAAVQPILALMGVAAPAADLYFDEADFLARYGNSNLYQAYYLQGQIRNACLFASADAEALALRLPLVAQSMRGQAKVPEATFHAALIWLRALRAPAGALDDEARAAIAARLAPLVGQLAGWARHAPANVGPKYALVLAERARNAGDVATAVDAYRAAADGAGEAGYVNIQALAHELCAQFWVEQGQPKVAAVFLRDAIGRYRQWGAHAKVALLQASPLARLGRAPYAGAPSTLSASGGVGTGTAARVAGNEALDLASLLKAAQALGNEIGLGAVLGRLIDIVRENAGAQVARLLLREGDGESAVWRLEADIDGDGARVLLGRPVDLFGGVVTDTLPLPLSVLRYVLRSGAAVIEERIADAPLFANDPHVRAHGARSVMCLPIRQGGRIDGLLYLENSLVEGCFTQERVEFLGMLGAQAMISIAHARMHDRLEARVAERTAQLEEANRQLATLSVTDSLTGLANRRHFDDVLRREWSRCQRAGASIGVIMLDIDHFKKYNDHYGHQAGDTCLAQVAAALQGVLRRPGDLVARYGGEEFCVVLPDTAAADAVQVGEHLRAAIATLALAHAAVPNAVVSISVGVAVVLPTSTAAADGLLHAADAALYAAKAGGRNMVVLAAP